MVDYSKWDSLDLSDDEEIDKKPRVQKFDAPQSVTFGGYQAPAITPQTSSKAQSNGKEPPTLTNGCDVPIEDNDEPMEIDDEELENLGDDEDLREDVLQLRGLAERALKNGNVEEGVRLLEKAMKIGGASCPGLKDLLTSAQNKLAAGKTVVVQMEQATQAKTSSNDSSMTTNGGVCEDRYAWSQTKDTVVVDVFVPVDTRAKDIQIKYDEIDVSLKVRNVQLFGGKWKFKVIRPEDADDIDWEFKTFSGRRTVRLTVRKADVPGGMGIVCWWSCVIQGDPGIDVSQIQGRKNNQNTSFADAWAAAHKEFKEKVKTRQKVDISEMMATDAAPEVANGQPYEPQYEKDDMEI